MKKIKLTKEQEAIVDDDDFIELSKYKWLASWNVRAKGFYAFRSVPKVDGKRKAVLMHRYVMELHGHDLVGKQVDHINHNTLDNRKSNLRACTNSENQMNRLKTKNNKSGFKGVSREKKSNSWRAQITINHNKIYLGCYKDKEDAYKAYITACKKYHGDFKNY